MKVEDKTYSHDLTGLKFKDIIYYMARVIKSTGDWRFNFIEMIGFAISFSTLAVGITLWSISTFQFKHDAVEDKKNMDTRVSNLEMITSNIAIDVSFIRGRMEKEKGR